MNIFIRFIAKLECEFDFSVCTKVEAAYAMEIVFSLFLSKYTWFGVMAILAHDTLQGGKNFVM